jgi:hypothetical protein
LKRNGQTPTLCTNGCAIAEIMRISADAREQLSLPGLQPTNDPIMHGLAKYTIVQGGITLPESDRWNDPAIRFFGELKMDRSANRFANGLWYGFYLPSLSIHFQSPARRAEGRPKSDCLPENARMVCL